MQYLPGLFRIESSSTTTNYFPYPINDHPRCPAPIVATRAQAVRLGITCEAGDMKGTLSVDLRRTTCDPSVDSDGGGEGDCAEFDAGRSPGNPADDLAGPDSDGDGRSDVEEGVGGAGGAGPPIDTDGDRKPDYQDTDSDQDGIPDAQEGEGDADGDGVPDWQDADTPARGCRKGARTLLKVGHATAVGCFVPVAGEPRVFATRARFQVGGFDVRPTGRVRIDLQRGRLSGPSKLSIGKVTLLRADGASALPTERASWNLDSATSALTLLVDLPAAGALRGKWVDGGAGFTAEISLDVTAMAEKSGIDAVVTGDFARNPGGSIAVAKRNGEQELDLRKVEVRLQELSLLPRGPKAIRRRISISDAMLRWKDDGAHSVWEGEATVNLPIGTSLSFYAIEGRLTIRDRELTAYGATVKNLNIPIPDTPLFVQDAGFDLQFKPRLAFALEGAISYGPRVLGKSFAEGSGRIESAGIDEACDGTTETFSGTIPAIDDIDELSANTTWSSCTWWDYSYLELRASPSLSLKDAIGVDGDLHGWLSGDLWQLEGTAKIRVPGPDIEGHMNVNALGVIACGPVTPWHDGGFSYVWGNVFPDLFSGCDLSQWRLDNPVMATPLVAPSERRTAVAVPVGQRAAGFRANADAGPPRLRLVAPDGTTIESPADPTAFLADERVIVAPEAERKRTTIVVRAPAAGEWRVEAADPGVVLTAVETARARPPAEVTASARRAGERVRLTWRLTPADGRRVTFVERGKGVVRTVTSTAAASGSITFRPSASLARARTVEAVVTEGGLPTAAPARVVARFTVPATRPPARPASATATARGGRLTLSWARADRAVSYVVTLHAGRQRLTLSTPRRRLVVGGLTWTPTSVQVRAVDRFGRTSAPRTVPVRGRP